MPWINQTSKVSEVACDLQVFHWSANEIWYYRSGEENTPTQVHQFQIVAKRPFKLHRVKCATNRGSLMLFQPQAYNLLQGILSIRLVCWILHQEKLYYHGWRNGRTYKRVLKVETRKIVCPSKSVQAWLLFQAYHFFRTCVFQEKTTRIVRVIRRQGSHKQDFKPVS